MKGKYVWLILAEYFLIVLFGAVVALLFGIPGEILMPAIVIGLIVAIIITIRQFVRAEKMLKKQQAQDKAGALSERRSAHK